MTNRTPPLGETSGLWLAVLAAASGCCQCRGACGKNHAKDGGRCPREHGGYQQHHGGGTVRLIVAPVDPAHLLLPAHRAAALPKHALAAWCPTCHDGARTLARRHQRTTAPAVEPDTLFDL
ncbi:hypothetical protein [Streptomyces sp. NRRL B-24484]|uniref:hypothetical protein n=1 Tax=Streptomyces sp. NRRL B-24484 TaxID=1463833 RepID=UPI0004BFE93B|nr:hypothetical protein [Streptomyces sp. NRRL B-24484]